jgi:RNA 2',3'-cyclic 3'-phosphodiesterase
MSSNSDTSTIKEIRTFIAIELPEKVKIALTSIQRDLKEPGQNFLKWVSSDSIHLTLKFLGNIDVDKVDSIRLAIEQTSFLQKRFMIGISEVGAFPNVERPRVIWVGINGDIGELIKLQKKLDDKLETIGFTKEKRAFSPHLTLARVAERATPQEIVGLSRKLRDCRANKKVEVEVSGLSFIRSQLFPAGPIYTTLAEIKFIA